MKSYLKLSLLALATSVLLTGCATGSNNGPMTAAIVRATVSTGALFGIAEDPTIVPYLQAATPVICDSAHQGKLNPAEVVNALQTAGIDQLKTPQGVAAVNAALAIYDAIYASYGTNVQTSSVQPYLEGVCLGLRDAVPSTITSNVKINRFVLPPHLSMSK